MLNTTDFIQTPESNEYRYLQPKWLDAIAKELTANAEKYPGETWRNIPSDEHAARAIRHLNLYRLGDSSEDHLIHAAIRSMMAFITNEANNNEKLQTISR